MECFSVKRCRRSVQNIVLFVYMFKENLMYQYMSNKLVFTRTQVLDSLFLMLMYILTYSDYCYSTASEDHESLNITAKDETWLHLVEICAATADSRREAVRSHLRSPPPPPRIICLCSVCT